MKLIPALVSLFILTVHPFGAHFARGKLHLEEFLENKTVLLAASLLN